MNPAFEIGDRVEVSDPPSWCRNLHSRVPVAQKQGFTNEAFVVSIEAENQYTKPDPDPVVTVYKLDVDDVRVEHTLNRDRCEVG